MIELHQKPEYIKTKEFDTSVNQVNSQSNRNFKPKFNIPVLEITPRSQKQRKAFPRSYLKAVKRMKNIREIKNNSLLNVKRLRIYEEAVEMLNNIRNIDSEPSEKPPEIDLKDNEIEEMPENTTKYDFHKPDKDNSRNLNTAQAQNRSKSTQSLSEKDVTNEVVYHKTRNVDERPNMNVDISK